MSTNNFAVTTYVTLNGITYTMTNVGNGEAQLERNILKAIKFVVRNLTPSVSGSYELPVFNNPTSNPNPNGEGDLFTATTAVLTPIFTDSTATTGGNIAGIQRIPGGASSAGDVAAFDSAVLASLSGETLDYFNIYFPALREAANDLTNLARNASGTVSSSTLCDTVTSGTVCGRSRRVLDFCIVKFVIQLV